jgi:hypothetical protein
MSLSFSACNAPCWCSIIRSICCSTVASLGRASGSICTLDIVQNAIAPLPDFVSRNVTYPVNSGRRSGTGASYSHPAGRAASCGGKSAIQLGEVADDQMNWPCSSRLVSMHKPTLSCHSSLISPARRPRNANTAPSNGSGANPCCTSIANPAVPLRISVAPRQVDPNARRQGDHRPSSAPSTWRSARHRHGHPLSPRPCQAPRSRSIPQAAAMPQGKGKAVAQRR